MKSFIPILALAMLSGCAARTDPGAVDDPWEPMNRRVHVFNRAIDSHLAKPVGARLGKGEGAGSTPGLGAFAVRGVGNFGANLAQPGKAVNHLLQGRPGPAVRTGFRFLVNSTLGLAGFLDPATADFALPEQDTDFGQTLAVWGVGEGPYLELPLIGPSTLRDATGRVVDLAVDPLHAVLNRDEYLIGLGARLVSKAGERARFGDTVDSVLHQSADSYAQTRLIWLQHRRFELGEEGEEIDPYAE
ncbi:MAG: VacJ family lipoprotein [Paracoccus sp. (in: a-proteobacteria)]|uniref:MlaA family lipoprotein n=1 Tax=Paracoccus sp. TaxID=267 RepID=UPI0039E27C98